MNICFPPRQRSTPVTPVRGLSQQSHPGVCADLFVEFVHIHHVQIAETAHRNTVLGDAKEAAEKLGPLKDVLGAIASAYKNHEVCQQPPSQKLPLMNKFSGIHRD